MIPIFFSFWRKSSFIFLFVCFFFVYIGLPENVAVEFNKDRMPISYIDKQNFFFFVAGIIFLCNFFFVILINQFEKINFSKLQLIGPWNENPNEMKTLIIGWLNALLAFINTLLVFVLVGLNRINGRVKQDLDFDYNTVMLVAATIFMIIFFFLPLKILFGKPSKS